MVVNNLATISTLDVSFSFLSDGFHRTGGML